ncbi:outer dynein arm-docking complex subunit 1-like isoform X1 [Sebastes fasciatus]|uniref:outer dynein arm-docking complex subunit 1-like isoform X1 n=1 Tax=Sebastes fasciatus TaxID=394691 RepID=UPI003D9EA91F
MSRSSAVRSQVPLNVSETDLNKLQLQYRRAEEAKREYTKKTQNLILRDEREIQRLQDEREELLRGLRVSQSHFKRWTDACVAQDLTAMLACGDRIDVELDAEKAKVASLEDQILEWEKKLAGKKARGETTHNLLKNIRHIENKLDKDRKCFNKMMSRNGELREELKQLGEYQGRGARELTLYYLIQELQATHKDICNLMTKCSKAFDDSVKIRDRKRMLVDQNAKDMALCIKEMSNLEREMYHYCNSVVFLDIKAVARTSQDVDHRKVEPKHLESEELGAEEFEDAIKKILTKTEESDLETLVRNFIQMEEQSYTLLKFVNYQHNEAESIQRQISQLCDEREIVVAEEQRQQEQHRALQKKVSIKREETEQQLAGYQKRAEVIEKLLDQLKKGVGSLLQISYGSSVTCDQLGSSDGVQDEIIIEYLRRVESRVIELLTLQSFLHYQESPNQWDTDSLGRIAGKLLGITPPAANLTTAAVATPAPTDDQDKVESVLLQASEPTSRKDLLKLIENEMPWPKRRESFLFVTPQNRRKGNSDLPDLNG